MSTANKRAPVFDQCLICCARQNGQKDPLWQAKPSLRVSPRGARSGGLSQFGAQWGRVRKHMFLAVYCLCEKGKRRNSHINFVCTVYYIRMYIIYVYIYIYIYTVCTYVPGQAPLPLPMVSPPPPTCPRISRSSGIWRVTQRSRNSL